jgi:Zn-dependent protease with chaperone function
MLNSYVNFFFLAAIISGPFYFQAWLRRHPSKTVKEINSKSSWLSVYTLGFMLISTFFSAGRKNSAQAIVIFGASFLSVMLIYSFRAKKLEATRKITVSHSDRLMQSIRSFALFMGTAGLFYAVMLIVSRVFGTVPAVAIAIIVSVLSVPLVFRIVYACRPMHASSMKNEIIAVFQKAGVKIAEIYLIDSNKMKAANAFVCGSKFGFGPMKRTLFLSEKLFAVLDEEEIKAVICHEASHFQLHHIAKRGVSALVIVVTALVAIGLPLGMLAASIPSKEWAAAIAIVNLVANMIFQYIFILRVIRKHEFEADLNAVVLGASPYALIQALEKISAANHISTDSEDWITRTVMGGSHPTHEQRREALYSHRLPVSARILPASRFIVSYAAVVLVIGAWFLNVKQTSVVNANREIASESRDSGK